MTNQGALLSPELLFERRRNADASAPFVTFYDDATGERAELSAASLGNWIAKTHFALMDSLGLGVGDQAIVALPVHWLAAPILFGCWFAGLQVVSTQPAGGSAVLFADADSLAALTAQLPAGGRLADDVFAVSMLSMARPDQPPAGAEDFTATVRPMPDAWQSVQPQAGPDEAALDDLSRAELASWAVDRAAGLELRPGGRLLWTRNTGPGPVPAADLACALLAPLAVGASVVLVRNPDPARLEKLISTERVTAIS